MIDEYYDAILARLDDLPGSHIDVLTRISEWIEKQEKVDDKQIAVQAINEIISTLEHTRLIMKYTRLDLEATTRERNVLRTLLEDQKDD